MPHKKLIVSLITYFYVSDVTQALTLVELGLYQTIK